jgi:predicted RNA polymerase sigma factor
MSLYSCQHVAKKIKRPRTINRLARDSLLTISCCSSMTPVIALNRALAVANIDGPQAGIEAAESIHSGNQLNSHYLLYTVIGEF